MSSGSEWWRRLWRSGLLYYQHPDKLGDAAGTLAALVAVVAVAPASAAEFLNEEKDAQGHPAG